MSLTVDEREQVATELKRFAGDLNLSDDQKQKLSTALTEAREEGRGLHEEQSWHNKSRRYRQGEGESAMRFVNG